MTLLSHRRLSERLGLLAVLLMLLAVLTGVSLSQAGWLDQGANALEDTALPALRRAQDLRRLVDDARGLEALQLLATNADERSTWAAQLQRQRRLVEHQLAPRPQAAATAEDPDEQRLKTELRQRLSQYWATQDKVMAALAQRVVNAPAEVLPAAQADQVPALAEAEARRLLAEESQAAWRALSDAISYWYQHHEQRAAELARASRSQADWLRLGTAGGLLGVVVFSGLAWLARRRGSQPSAAAAPTGAAYTPGLPEALDGIAMHSRLVALNAAVQAARQGQPTPADLSERAHLASEAEALARRCDAARRGLRLGTVRARSFAATQPPGAQGTGPSGADSTLDIRLDTQPGAVSDFPSIPAYELADTASRRD